LRENKKKCYKCVDWEEKKTKHLETFGEKDENEKKKKKKKTKQETFEKNGKTWEEKGAIKGRVENTR
jgi:hypothetical protein